MHCALQRTDDTGCALSMFCVQCLMRRSAKAGGTMQVIVQQRQLGMPEGGTAQLALQMAVVCEHVGLRQDTAQMALQALQLCQQHTLALGLKERQVHALISTSHICTPHMVIVTWPMWPVLDVLLLVAACVSRSLLEHRAV